MYGASIWGTSNELSLRVADGSGGPAHGTCFENDADSTVPAGPGAIRRFSKEPCFQYSTKSVLGHCGNFTVGLFFAPKCPVQSGYDEHYPVRAPFQQTAKAAYHSPYYGCCHTVM